MNPQRKEPESRAIYDRLLRGRATPKEYTDALRREAKERVAQLRHWRLFR